MKIIPPKNLIINCKPGDKLVRTKKAWGWDESYMEGQNCEANGGAITIYEVYKTKVFYFCDKLPNSLFSFNEDELVVGGFLDNWKKIN